MLFESERKAHKQQLQQRELEGENAVAASRRQWQLQGDHAVLPAAIAAQSTESKERGPSIGTPRRREVWGTGRRDIPSWRDVGGAENEGRDQVEGMYMWNWETAPSPYQNPMAQSWGLGNRVLPSEERSARKIRQPTPPVAPALPAVREAPKPRKHHLASAQWSLAHRPHAEALAYQSTSTKHRAVAPSGPLPTGLITHYAESYQRQKRDPSLLPSVPALQQQTYMPLDLSYKSQVSRY